jgi:ubiquinone/menaquinone biosynthesis C-methylase UbiE
MVKLKTFFSTIYWFPISSKNKIEKYQERIRQLEWNAILQYIPENSSFLDVGCGAGYSLMKAHTELGCSIQGIDPAPGAHGVGRYASDEWKSLPILKGSAEELPFEDNSFDVVYSSHVLEHVVSEEKALIEMKRVLKPEGVLIIGMPTSSMSWVALISSWVFTTHISIYNLIVNGKGNKKFSNVIRIFIPTSHSFPRAKYITYDLNHYRVSNWKKIVSNKFEIYKVITPGLYPYPDYIQWFPLFKKCKISSSVFFICKNKV